MKKLVQVFKKTQEQTAKQAEKTARDLREKMQRRILAKVRENRIDIDDLGA
jgi:hypothetical protein